MTFGAISFEILDWLFSVSGFLAQLLPVVDQGQFGLRSWGCLDGFLSDLVGSGSHILFGRAQSSKLGLLPGVSLRLGSETEWSSQFSPGLNS